MASAWRAAIAGLLAVAAGAGAGGGGGGGGSYTVVWAGAPTPTAVRLAVRPRAASATLVVSTRRDLAAPLATHRVTRDEFIVDVEGLTPETQYYYGLEADPAAAVRSRDDFYAWFADIERRVEAEKVARHGRERNNSFSG